jgi:ATP-binding cassette subfamily F protein 3
VKALADFEGAVLLITHDPHLVELVADRLWLVADGTVHPFDGDLDDYRVLLAERARSQSKGDGNKAEPLPRKDDRRERAAARAALAPLRKQAKDAEALLANLTAERAAIEAKLADPALYASGLNATGRAADINRANARLVSIRREAAAAEAAWLAAEEALEAAS